MKKDFYILQIEDEKVLAEQTENMIKENCPFITRMKTVGTGEKGIEEIQKEMPDFIILNQYMPGITGLEMLERCHSLGLKLPEVIVITGGLKSKMEEDRLYELGVKYISSRFPNEFQRKYIFGYIERAYNSSTKIEEEDMTRIIMQEIEPIVKRIKNDYRPYAIIFVAFILRYLVKNDVEYSKEYKDSMYELLKKENDLKEYSIQGIKDSIDKTIEICYIKGSMIKLINYRRNKDEIQEEFFHKLKEDVLKDIIAESN